MFNWPFYKDAIIDIPSMKVIDEMMQTENWNAFATGVDGAMAIGGPTLEMWIESWNARHEDKKLYYNVGSNRNTDGSVYVDDRDWDGVDDTCNISNGYLVGYGNSGTLTDYLYQSDFHLNDELFESNQCYWLSAPSPYFEDHVWSAGGSNSILCGIDPAMFDDWTWGYGARPVVCLPKSLNAHKEDAKWIIDN